MYDCFIFWQLLSSPLLANIWPLFCILIVLQLFCGHLVANIRLFRSHCLAAHMLLSGCLLATVWLSYIQYVAVYQFLFCRLVVWQLLCGYLIANIWLFSSLCFVVWQLFCGYLVVNIWLPFEPISAQSTVN